MIMYVLNCRESRANNWVFLLWEIKNHYWKNLLSFWRFIISGWFHFHLKTAAAHVSLILWRGWFFVRTGGWILLLLFVVTASATCHHREELLHSEGNSLLVKSRTNIAVTCNLLFTLQWLYTLHCECDITILGCGSGTAVVLF